MLAFSQKVQELIVLEGGLITIKVLGTRRGEVRLDDVQAARERSAERTGAPGSL
jgi:sRNA-binding carbon storage regulator CsrA